MKTNSTTITLLNNSKNVKQRMLNFLLLGFSILFLASCSKNDDNDIIVERILDGLEFEAEILENREEAVQTFTVDIAGRHEIRGANGTILYFSPNSLADQNGDPVSGPVTIELIEIYDKATMLLTKMPTNGKRLNGDVEALKSAGEFYVNATQNGEQLVLATNFQLFAPSDEFDENMRIFNGEDPNCAGDEMQCDIVWEEEEEQGRLEPIQREGPNGQGVSGYGGFISNFGWTNLDRWYSFEGPKTIVYADPPSGFDNTNSNVYISYDGEATALALLDIYNADTGLFSEHYGLIPVGLEVHFIFVSVQDDQYVYAIQGATIGEDHTEVIGTTTTGTEAELVALINDLP